MLRETPLAIVTVLALVALATEVGAESPGRTCRRVCQDEVQACIDAGGKRAKCRRTVQRQCREQGVTVCLSGEEARKASGSTLYAPSALWAVAPTPNLVSLAWTDANSVEHGYSIERSMNGVNFVEIVRTGQNVLRYDDPGRFADTTYYYRSRAFRTKGRTTTWSSYSAVASVRTPANGGTTTTTTLPTTSSTSTTSTSTTLLPTTTTTVVPTTTTTTTRPPTTTTTVAPTTTTTTTRPPTTTTTSTSTSTSTTRPTTTTTSSSTSTSSTSTSTSTSTTSTTAPNQAPRANAGADRATQTLTAIAFNGGASFDPDGSIVSYAWSFGDGTGATGIAPSKTYASAGTYTVTLTVTDNKGATGTDTAVMSIANRPPVANAGADQGGGPGAPVAFDGRGSSDPDGTITSYAWSFGDGTTGTGATVSHAYATAGTYTVTLTVRDNHNAQSSDTAVATITALAGGTWARRVGDASSDGAYALGTDAAGNVFVGGSFRGTVTIGNATLTSAGGADWFVAKYDPAGSVLWARAAGGTSDDAVETLAVDGAGNVVVAGRIAGMASLGGAALVSNGTSDMAIVKYRGADGAHVWSNRFGGAYDDNCLAVAVDGAGEIYMTGYFRGTTSFGGATLRVPYVTDLDVFVAKLTAGGVHVWSKNFPNDGNERGYGLAVDGLGGVAVVGSFSNAVDFGGGQLVSVNAMMDAFVVKLAAATGAHVWSRRMGAPDGNEAAYAVTADAAGNVVVGGYAMKAVDFGGGLLGALGGTDAFVASYRGTTGAHLWSRRLGGSGNDYAYGVALAPDGGIVVGGSFDGTAAFGGGSVTTSGSSDVFAAKYTSTGAAVWARGLGGGSADVASEIAMTPTGHPVLAGYFNGASSFGGATLTSAGMADAFVTKIAP